jgi:steroid delta-isomerase-like uncharacterized protein
VVNDMEVQMKYPLSIIAVVILLCFTVSCQDTAKKAELDKFSARAKLQEQNKEIVKRYWNGKWNERRPDILDELQTADVVNYGTSTKINNLKEYKQVYGVFLSAFHDTHLTIEEMIAEGDRVMTRVLFSGVQKGDLEGIPATGKTVTISIFTVFRLVNGKIAEEWEIYDDLGMMQQLGMELKPREAIKK